MELQFNDLPKAVSELQTSVRQIEQLLLQKAGDLKQEEEQLLTIKQASYYLKVTVPTIYGYVSRAEIPVYKKGKRLYFLKNDLIKWVQDGKKLTKEEIASAADAYLKKGEGRK